jgi:hypothetical protein
MRRVKEVAFNLFIVVIILYAGLIAYWLLYPYKPNVVKPIEIMNPGKIVMAGDWLVYKITYDKKMNVPGVLTRKLVNSFKLDLSDSVATSPIKKGEDLVYVEIPKNADPGKYNLLWSVTYRVNPIRSVVVSTTSEDFYIIQNPKDDWRGHMGIQGKQGIQGKKGEQGIKGDKGGITLFGKVK